MIESKFDLFIFRELRIARMPAINNDKKKKNFIFNFR